MVRREVDVVNDVREVYNAITTFKSSISRLLYTLIARSDWLWLALLFLLLLNPLVYQWLFLT